VNKKLDRGSKIGSDQFCEVVDLQVGFVHIQVPRKRQMAINMKNVSIFNDPQVVKVHPICPAMFIEYMRESL
jgi:hypothetical protein